MRKGWAVCKRQFHAEPNTKMSLNFALRQWEGVPLFKLRIYDSALCSYLFYFLGKIDFKFQIQISKAKAVEIAN